MTLLQPDAQIEVRKSAAAALWERTGPVPERNIHAIVYPYSVDVERIADGLWGVDKIDNGSDTMSVDLVLEKVPRRSRRTANVVEDDRVDGFGGDYEIEQD